MRVGSTKCLWDARWDLGSPSKEGRILRRADRPDTLPCVMVSPEPDHPPATILGIQLPAFADNRQDGTALRLYDVPSWMAAALTGGGLPDRAAARLSDLVAGIDPRPVGQWLGWHPTPAPVQGGMSLGSLGRQRAAAWFAALEPGRQVLVLGCPAGRERRPLARAGS